MLPCRLARAMLVLIASALPAWAQGGQVTNSVAPGRYHCVFFIGGQGLQTTPGFTIHSGGTYRHDGGTSGRFAFDAGRSVMTFQGGALDGQAGLVETKGSIAYIRLYNERRSRTVIDCDLKGR
jgi:hypothetical protein